MKIAFVADAHLIADADPHQRRHAARGFFKDAWPSFAALLDRVNDASPDVVVLLGDLVDWFSEANVDFALELVSRLKRPWLWTPGNHDLEEPDGVSEAGVAAARDYWRRRGCDGGSRIIDAGAAQVLLFDSALSVVAKETQAWVEASISAGEPAIIATHVPVDCEAVRAWIRKVAPSRNLQKYVQSGSPNFYPECLQGRIRSALAGHLHLEGEVKDRETEFRFLNMAISCHDQNRDTRYVASATILDTMGGSLRWHKLVVA
ncbi:MAG: hypothetical protein EA425_05640 [Puniceicoccaceae bacterium]|nr:MAG: hypothetical protein EA425_05640 [Puniceicoccaceae bacterium]